MGKRLCVFSFYDKDGYVDDYVRFLLMQVLPCVDKIIIAVNGKLDKNGQALLEQYANEVYIRDNTGFDAGAYKYVLCQKLSQEEISAYDEIFLCNDTFFGPFVPMKDIFEKMENVDCDVWGLNGYVDWPYEHLQSYFLVFRKRVIEEKLLINYLNENIDEYAVEVNHVYCQFENGLFDYLVRQKEMKYATYITDNQMWDVYKYSYAYLKDLQFPIVKRKVFTYLDVALDNVMCTLSYIKNNTDYDIGLVLKNISRIYGVKIESKDIKKIDEYAVPIKSTFPTVINGAKQIEKFIENEEFFVYGTGMCGCNTYWRYAKGKEKFQGFVISDGQPMDIRELFGYPIKYFSEIENLSSYKVLLGVKAEIAEAVIKQFSDCSKVMRIF